MARFDPILSNFSSGEFSKLLIGRVDIAKYANGVDTLENFLIMLQGGITRRPGSRFIKETKTSSKASRLLPFQYSADLDYIMEMGDIYMRFFANDATTVDAAATWDTYYKLMLHGDGTDLATAITDEIGKTVTNTANYDSYTKFMCHFEGTTTTFVDEIDNVNHAITAVGTATQSTSVKKFGAKSLELDGDSDYLTVLDSADWNFGTGDFTIDVQLNMSSYSGSANYMICGQIADADNNWQINLISGSLRILFRSGGNIKGQYSCPFTPTLSTFYHLEFSRYGTGAKIFINGVSQTLTETVAFGANDVGNVAAVLSIGAGLNTSSSVFDYFVPSYIDEVKISKGITRHISDFTAPVAPYGQVTIDTGVKKFGTGSMLFDGSGSILSLADSADWNFGTGDWSIDGWVYFNVIGKIQVICGQYEDANNYWFIQIDAANKLHLKFVDDAAGKGEYIMTSAWSGLAVNTLYHVEFCRSTTTAKIFINGTSQTLTETTAFSTNNVGDMAAALIMGAQNSLNHFEGHIDELRVNKGIARNTANFTAPASAYEKTVEPLELVSPYLEADIFEVQQAHKGDLKYMTHIDYAPRIVSRTSATVFSIALADIKRGPFLDTNVTAALTITPSADTGAGITLTAAAPGAFHYDAADGDPDAQLQVGSLWRIKSGVVKILTVVSATVATADVQTEPDGSAGNLATGPGATADWAEGAFSGYRGYPAVCCFHDGRLWYASTEYEPQNIWGSNLYDYDNFNVSSTPADDEAVTFEIATEERVAIRWMLSGNKALAIGSTGGTFSAYGTANAPITPSDIQVNRDTNYGSALLPAKRISSFNFYIQRNLHKIRELSYFYDYDITRASDMTMLAEHILREGSGIVDWDYQQSPNDRLWCVRDDGQIAVITRNPEQDVMGWSRIIAGEDSYGVGQYESVCVIPKQNDDDQVWVIVRRMINGTEKRFIEVFTNENFDEEWDAVCLDSSLTLDDPGVITGMTNASPGVFTCATHGFTGGEQVKINGVVLAKVAGVASVDVNGTYLLVYINANTFSLTTLAGVAINTITTYGTYVSGGEVREMVTAISGLSHLNGETIQVTIDADVPTSNSFVVSAGMITLLTKSAVVHAGLPYTPYMKTLRPEGGSAAGVSQGKLKKIVKITARFYRTLACQLGGADRQDRFDFTELFTGDKDLPVPMSTEKEGQLIVTSDKPLPLTLISLMPKITVGDDN